MTSTQLLRRNEEAQRQRSLRRSGQHLQSVEMHAHVADDYRREGHDISGRLQEIEDNNPDFRDLNMGRVIGYVGITALLVCAYLFDIVLFWPTAMFVAEGTFGDNRPLVVATSIVIPALILAAEISVASHRHLAREEARRSAYTGATVLALVMLVVMPAMVISTHPYMRYLEDGNVEGTMLRWQALSFVALVIVTHGLILFGGEVGHRAKSYVAFAFIRRRLRRAARRAEEGFVAQARRAAADFKRYRQTLDGDDRGAIDPTQLTAFDQTTRGVLLEHFGHEADNNSDRASHGDGETRRANHNNGTRPLEVVAVSSNGTGRKQGGNNTPPSPPDPVTPPPHPEPTTRG